MLNFVIRIDFVYDLFYRMRHCCYLIFELLVMNLKQGEIVWGFKDVKFLRIAGLLTSRHYLIDKCM